VTDGRHALIEETSLELHRAVAERLLDDPSLLSRAQTRVEEWLATGAVARPLAEAWKAILARPPADVARALSDPGERARDLRQTSPFAGALDPRTRWSIFRRIRGGTTPS